MIYVIEHKKKPLFHKSIFRRFRTVSTDPSEVAEHPAVVNFCRSMVLKKILDDMGVSCLWADHIETPVQLMKGDRIIVFKEEGGPVFTTIVVR